MRIDDLIVEVRNPSLERIGQIVPQDLVGATFVARFNNVGAWSITLPYGNLLGEQLRLPGYGIVVTRSNGEPILSGPTLTAKLEQTRENTEGNWQIEGSTDDILLSERLAYPTPTTADVTQQTSGYDLRSGATETVIKGYVEANLGATAPVARQVDNLVIEADQARGETVFAKARFDNLHTLIYDLAQISGLGFAVTQDGDELVFAMYEPTDRSDTIRMDIQNRKLASAVYSYGTARVTRAIVAGRGEAENRVFIERSNTDSIAAESLWGRRIEVFKDRRDAEETNQLNTAGDEMLADKGKTIVEMSVVPSDDQTMIYGVDWFLGDRVTVVANEIESTAVVTEVGIQIAEDGVRIGATVGTPLGIEFEAKLLAKQEDQENRISNLERSATGYGINTIYQPEGGTDGTQPTFSGPAISGSFNRFGNMVHVSILVDFTNITSFGTGQYYLTLPYPARIAYMFRDGCLHDDSESVEYHISGHVDADDDVLKLFTTDRQGNRIYDFPFSQGEPITLTTADSFHIAGTYEIEG
jgi:hypothetical protein